MNAAQKEYLRIARQYKGAKVGSKKHHELVDAFNLVAPDGWKMTYTAPWCAATVSAWAVLAFGPEIARRHFPLSANCGTIVEHAQRMGLWRETDSITPDLGDWLLYDWQDSGAGDNHGIPDHVGMVDELDRHAMTVLEGNKGVPGAVGERSVRVNGRYIRGYVCINWGAVSKDWIKKPEKQPKQPAPKYKTGTYKVTASNGLNVRKGPGTQYGVIRAIAKGSRFNVSKVSGAWGYCKALGGWLCLPYAKRI